MNRRGFTLTELLMTLTITGVLGVALMRIMISDSRFVSRQDAMMSARQGARAAMHTTVAELRSISGPNTNEDPIRAVSPDSIRARIPYAFGVFCRYTSGVMKAALLPTDSLAYANAVSVNRGVYFMDSTGTYDRIESGSVTVTTSTATSACISGTDTVRVLPGGRLVQIAGLASISSAAQSFGRIFYLYQDVTYFFGTSLDASLSGRRALFRRLRNANGAVISPADELVAPFDTSAKFRCLVGVNLTVEACPTSGDLGDLSDELRGLELRLVAASDQKPQGSTTYQKFDLSTRIVFANRNE